MNHWQEWIVGAVILLCAVLILRKVYRMIFHPEKGTGCSCGCCGGCGPEHARNEKRHDCCDEKNGKKNCRG